MKNEINRKSRQWINGLIMAMALIVGLLTLTSAKANDLQISSVTVTGQNTSLDYALVQFDIGWSNSWRLSTGLANWDAAWVFVKYRVNGGIWQHATLNTTGETEPSGSTIDIPTDGTGAFIYRSSTGSGSLALSGVQLRWNYGVDGVLDVDLVDIQVIGIEMVYAPQDAFAAGSGGIRANEYSLTTINTADASVDATRSGGFSGSPQGGNPQLASWNPTSNYPNGYNAFYSMKYEITQQQYVDFLNTLDGTQQASRIAAIIVGEFMSSASGVTAPNNNNGVKCKIAPSGSTAGEYGNDLNNNDTYDESADGHNIACNFMKYLDLAAYADWAGLRPMTELEFEKASRGIVGPTANEFAWGTTNIHSTSYTLTSTGTAAEGISDMGTDTGNCFWALTNGSLLGPVRVGIFAANAATKNREETGASFYGIMELSGNLEELLVDTYATESETYDGQHGDRILDSNGDPDVSNWLASGLLGTIRRASGWNNNDFRARVSDRISRGTSDTNRAGTRGGRLVRTAP